MKLKVLHIIPTLVQGGAEKLLFDLVSNSRDTMDMKVVTLLADAPFFKLDPDRVQSLAMHRGRLSPRAFFQLREIIRTFAPDVVHAWLYHGNLFSVAAGSFKNNII